MNANVVKKVMATYHRGMTWKVTCKLTASTPGSAQGPTLGNKYGRTLPFLIDKKQGKRTQPPAMISPQCGTTPSDADNLSRMKSFTWLHKIHNKYLARFSVAVLPPSLLHNHGTSLEPRLHHIVISSHAKLIATYRWQNAINRLPRISFLTTTDEMTKNQPCG